MRRLSPQQLKNFSETTATTIQTGKQVICLETQRGINTQGRQSGKLGAAWNNRHRHGEEHYTNIIMT